MKSNAFFRILCFGLLGSLPAFAQTQTADQPTFRTEIHATSDRGPSFTLTNLSAKTLSAAQIRFSSSSKAVPSTEMGWDPILQGTSDPRSQLPGPLEPGAGMTMFLPHVVGRPPPDAVDVIAGIWADGETFGQPGRVKLLLQNRTSAVASYEQAIAFLRRGLEQNWTRDQYLKELSSQNSRAFDSIASTLRANNRPDSDSRSIKLAMTFVLEHLTRNLNLLRQAKP